MALSKPVGTIATATGLVAGVVTIIGALADPDTSACIARVAGALGPHAAAIGAAIIGGVTAVAPLIAWFAHPPVPLSPAQQASDDAKAAS